jgi:hypothetical protein
MMKKYELLAEDCLIAGDRTVYRIRALRDFGDVRHGDLGGYIESEDNLCHAGDAWVYDAAQVYGPFAVVRDNDEIARARPPERMLRPARARVLAAAAML